MNEETKLLNTFDDGPENREPRVRHMLSEYAAMFRGSNLRFGLVSSGVIFALLLFYIYGPSSVSPSTPLFFRIIAFLNGYLLLGWGAVLVFALISPLLARVILPCTVMSLEAAKFLLTIPEYWIDVLIEWMVKTNFSPLRPDENHCARILGITSVVSEDANKRYRDLLTKYDPDKLKQFGPEFAELAEHKRAEISRAYRILVNEGWILDCS